MASDNYIDYPSMTRQREDQIQQGSVAKADDVNAEFNNVVTTYNSLVALLQGEFGGNGRIYELVDEAVAAANQAKADAANAVKKTGDTMKGQLMTQLEPSSPYSMVNKSYVDSTISTSVGPTSTLANSNKDRLDNLDATNVKLSNGNFSSNTVDGGMTELFQSVSSGKAAIASAITDKGVTTDANATFTKMHDNIYSIVTFAEGTALGNITPEKVLKGYLGYSKGQAIYGTHECDASSLLEQADSLIPDNIAYGKKAFGSNGLITGTHKDSGGGTEYPTYGTDTSDATATASDILEGKVAYSQGVRLTGTLKQVEELYKYDFESIAVGSITGNVLGEIIDLDGTKYMITGFKLSRDCASIVRVGYAENDNTKEVVFSNPIIDNQIVVEQSISAGGELTTKKYKYTAEELGLNGLISAFDITCGGVLGNSNLAYLVIYTDSSTASDYRVDEVVHIYPYHLTGNRQIGPLTGETAKNYTFNMADYKTERETTGNYYFKLRHTYVNITFIKNDMFGDIVPNKSPYYIVSYIGLRSGATTSQYRSLTPVLFKINPYAEQDSAVLQRLYSMSVAYRGDDSYRKYMKFYEDDSYYYTIDENSLLWIPSGSIDKEFDIYLLDSNYSTIETIPNAILKTSPESSDNYRYWINCAYNKENSFILDVLDEEEQYKIPGNINVSLLNLFKLVKDNETGTYSKVRLKSINYQVNNELYNMEYGYNHLMYASWVGNTLIAILSNRGNESPFYLWIIEFDNTGTVLGYKKQRFENGSLNYPQYTRMLNFYNNHRILQGDNNFKLFYNINNDSSMSNTISNPNILTVGMQETEEIIAIKYKGTTYYSSSVNSLTAGQPDVRAGKTFIGYMGYVEEGTMGVE